MVKIEYDHKCCQIFSCWSNNSTVQQYTTSELYGLVFTTLILLLYSCVVKKQLRETMIVLFDEVELIPEILEHLEKPNTKKPHSQETREL